MPQEQKKILENEYDEITTADDFLFNSTMQIEVKHLAKRAQKEYDRKALELEHNADDGRWDRKNLINDSKKSILFIGLSYVLVLALLVLANSFFGQFDPASIGFVKTGTEYHFEKVELSLFSQIVKYVFFLSPIVFIPLMFSSRFHGIKNYIGLGILVLLFTIISWELVSVLFFNLGSNTLSSTTHINEDGVVVPTFEKWHIYSRFDFSSAFYFSDVYSSDLKTLVDANGGFASFNSTIFQTVNYSAYFYNIDASYFFETNYYVVGGFITSAFASVIFASEVVKKSNHYSIKTNKVKIKSLMHLKMLGAAFASTLIVLALLPLLMILVSSVFMHSFAFVAGTDDSASFASGTSLSFVSLLSYSLANLWLAPFFMMHFTTGLGAGGTVLSAIFNDGLARNIQTYSNIAFINNGAIAELTTNYGTTFIVPICVTFSFVIYARSCSNIKLQNYSIAVGVFVMLAGSYAAILYMSLLFVFSMWRFARTALWASVSYIALFGLLWLLMATDSYVYAFDSGVDFLNPDGTFNEYTPSHIEFAEAGKLENGGSFIGLEYYSTLLKTNYFGYDTGLVFMIAQTTDANYVQSGQFSFGKVWIFILSMIVAILVSISILVPITVQVNVAKRQVLLRKLVREVKFIDKFENHPLVRKMIRVTNLELAESNYIYKKDTVGGQFDDHVKSLYYDPEQLRILKSDDFFDSSKYVYDDGLAHINDDVEIMINAGQKLFDRDIDIASEDISEIKFLAELGPDYAKEVLERQFNLDSKPANRAQYKNKRQVSVFDKAPESSEYEFERIDIVEQIEAKPRLLNFERKDEEPDAVSVAVKKQRHLAEFNDSIKDYKSNFDSRNTSNTNAVVRTDPNVDLLKREFGDRVDRSSKSRESIYSELIIKWAELVYSKTQYLIKRLDPTLSNIYVTLDRKEREERHQINAYNAKIASSRVAEFNQEFGSDIKMVSLINRNLEEITTLLQKPGHESLDKEKMFGAYKEIENDALFIKNLIIKYTEKLAFTKAHPRSSYIETRDVVTHKSAELLKTVYEGLRQVAVSQENRKIVAHEDGYSTPNKRGDTKISQTTAEKVEKIYKDIAAHFVSNSVEHKDFRDQLEQINFAKSQIDHIRSGNELVKAGFSPAQVVELERENEELNYLRDELATQLANSFIKNEYTVNQGALNTILIQITNLRKEQRDRLGVEINVPGEVDFEAKHKQDDSSASAKELKAKVLFTLNNLLDHVGKSKNVTSLYVKEDEISMRIADDLKIDKAGVLSISELSPRIENDIIYLNSGQLTEQYVAEFAKFLNPRSIKRR